MALPLKITSYKFLGAIRQCGYTDLLSDSKNFGKNTSITLKRLEEGSIRLPPIYGFSKNVFSREWFKPHFLVSFNITTR